MTISVGTHLGPYEIIAPIGAGGMGEVYRARDPRLGREVAIKVLPVSMACDQERVLRFEREAKLLASLNHPNIAQIYGFEESGDQKFIVLEYVEGDDLAARLKRGPVPVDEALELGRQVARALEAAHGKGVIHRDLKPGNVMITPGGKVKVLDFGLACTETKDTGPVSSEHDSPTQTVHSPAITADFTRPGVIMGTAAYMSPEQARGKPVDKRTDTWSFGVLLYECLTGQSLFRGETTTDTMGAILHRDPDWSALPHGTPPTIHHLLRRCLRRDRNRRLHDIADARVELEEAITDPSDSVLGLTVNAPESRNEKSRPSLALTMLAVAVVALASALAAWQLKPIPMPPKPVLRKLEIQVPGLRTDERLRPIISPDGSRVVYAAKGSLWVRSLDDLEAIELTGTKGASSPFWSPDSSQVGFQDGSRLWRMPVTGGTRSLICITSQSISDWGGVAWTADDRILFTTAIGGPFWEVPAGGGEPTVALSTDPDLVKDFHFASELPNNAGVLSVLHKSKGGGDIADTIVLVKNGTFESLLEHPGEELFAPVYANGHILYGRAQTSGMIWAVPFSLESLEVTGPSFLVAESAELPSVSRDGTLVYSASTHLGTGQLVWVDRTGADIELIGQPQEGLMSTVLSPDNTKVAALATETGAYRIWIHDLVRATRRPFAVETKTPWLLGWITNERLAFTDGDTTYMQSVTQSTPPVTLIDHSLYTISEDRRYGATEQRSGTSLDIYYFDLQEGGDALPLTSSNAAEFGPTIRPAGDLMAYVSDETGSNNVYLVEFPSGEGKRQVSINESGDPLWSQAGDELFFVTMQENDSVLMSVGVTTEPELRVTEPRPLFSVTRANLNTNVYRSLDVSADGQRILGVRSVTTESETRRITVVQNWYREFKKP